MSRPLDPRLLRAVPAVRRLLAALAGLQVIGAMLTVVQASALASIVVSVFGQQRSAGGLLVPLLALALAAAGRAAVAGGQEWLTARVSARARAGLRRAVLVAITRLGPAWAARQPSGRLITAAGPGLDALDGYLTRALPALVSASVVPAIVLGWIGLIDWPSALVLVLVLPLVPTFMVLVGITTGRRMQAQYASLARLSGHFLDLLEGLTTLKVYGQAKRQVQTVRAATEDYRLQAMATLRTAFLSGLVLDLIATLSVAVVAVDVGLRLDHASLGLRPALLVLLLAPELFAPLRAVGAQHHASEEGLVAAAAALDILDEAAALANPTELAGAPGPATGQVRLAAVSVRYPQRAEAALRGLDLQLRAGELVAVQGPSGAGKSTLLGLLLGFIEPTEGSVLVATTAGERALTQLAPESWRANLAWVPQRPQPTQPTVGAEVALGDPAAGADAVAAAIADCHAPHPGTVLGEDGGQVSAGQRRRIAVARALLRARAVRAAGGVPLVLLDEPTEDLDRDTERVVTAVIAGMAGWASVVMVTHSPRLAAIADRVLTIEQGRLSADQAQLRLTPDPVSPREPVPAGAAASVRPGQPAAADPVGLADLIGGWRAAGRKLVLAAGLAGATGLAGLALTATSVWLICRAAQHPNVQALSLAVVGVRTFALSRALLRYAERLVGHDAALRLLAEVRARVFAALEPLAPAGLAEFRRGDLLRRFVADVDGLQDGLVRAVIPFLGAAVTAAGASLVALLISPTAGLVLAAGLLSGLLLVPLLARALSGDADALTGAAGLRDERATALLAGLDELICYGADPAAIAAVQQADQQVIDASRRPALAAAGSAALAGLSFAVTVPALLAVTAQTVHAGLISPIMVGVLVACALAAFDVLAPLPAAFAAWARVRSSLHRVGTLLGTPAPIAEPIRAGRAPEAELGLRLRAVTVAPSATAEPVLRAADLLLPVGQRVAVIGPSGCGKSTVLAAAMRLLAVRAGAIELTGTGPSAALADLPAAAVPPLIAGSLQGDHVFNASLRDNLRVVRPEATDADLDAVAARCGLAEVVAELPLGWSTPTGPDAAELSGGQRQRLLLARALLADPRVLVLDEPTAHLDAETERQVLADLLHSTRHRTVLMSTHRRLPPGEFDQVLLIRQQSMLALIDEPEQCPVPGRAAGRGNDPELARK